MGTVLLSSTETANEGRAVPATTVAAGWTVKPTSAGVFVATLTAALVIVAKPVSGASVSDAVRAQLEPLVIVSELKVATPALAVASVVPPRVHEEVICIVSIDPVPVGTTLPNWSSTETLKVANATPIVPVVGGTVVYAILVAAVGVTATAALVAVVTPDVEVSDATRVQLVPVVIVTALNVASPATAATEVVPVRVHEEVMATVSVEPVPEAITVEVLSSTFTEKLASAVPATVVVGGSVL
jgi:hypothetical protein